MGIKSGHSSRIACTRCGDGVHQGRGMIREDGKWVTCPVCGGAGWIYIKD